MPIFMYILFGSYFALRVVTILLISESLVGFSGHVFFVPWCEIGIYSAISMEGKGRERPSRGPTISTEVVDNNLEKHVSVCKNFES